MYVEASEEQCACFCRDVLAATVSGDNVALLTGFVARLAIQLPNFC